MKIVNKFLVLTIIILPLIVRIANYDLTRIHGDDLIVAYFSANYDFLKDNFFKPVPQDRIQWVSQFPSVFFVLQKTFFIIFGETLLTVKLSVLPYILIVSLILYLLAVKIFDKVTAAISVILYSFLAVSLYHETLGLHFISSTAVFMVFFYFLLKFLEAPTLFRSVLVGIFCGFSYFFYSSSYIAIPILVIISLISSLVTKKKVVLLNLLIILFVCFLTLSPFIYYMVKSSNFYLRQRIDQVNLISGQWSGQAKEIQNGRSSFQIIKQNLMLSLKSFYQDGIGGHGGYDFGHLAFFDKFSLILFVLGLILGLKFYYKKTELIYLWTVIFVSFVTGVVLTIPPPAFHRFSLAFPFLVLIMSIPFNFILQSKLRSSLKYTLIFFFLFFYIYSNESYFFKAVKAENNNESLRLANLINSSFPGRSIHVAAFPGFAFEKIYYFSPNKKNYRINTDYHINFIRNFNRSEKYVYLIIFPDVFKNKFEETDPKGRIILFSGSYSLFVN